jgi:hypothetical protein
MGGINHQNVVAHYCFTHVTSNMQCFFFLEKNSQEFAFSSVTPAGDDDLIAVLAKLSFGLKANGCDASQSGLTPESQSIQKSTEKNGTPIGDRN